jgi:hypothetical protein
MGRAMGPTIGKGPPYRLPLVNIVYHNSQSTTLFTTGFRTQLLSATTRDRDRQQGSRPNIVKTTIYEIFWTTLKA